MGTSSRPEPFDIEIHEWHDVLLAIPRTGARRNAEIDAAIGRSVNYNSKQVIMDDIALARRLLALLGIDSGAAPN